MQFIKRFLPWTMAVPLVAAVLAACGGGGDSPAASMAEAAGTYTGSTSTRRDLTSILLADGRYYLIYSGVADPGTTGGFVHGTATVDNGVFASADGIDYNLEGTGTTSGAIAARVDDSFSGTLRPSTASAVDFRTFYDPRSERVPTLAALAGTYPGTVQFSLGARAGTFVVTPAGELSTVINGCTITGNAVPRTDTNAYDLTIVFGGAPCVFPNFTFTGVAFYADGRLLAAVRNTAINQAIVFSGTR